MVADLLCHLVVYGESNFCHINSCSKNKEGVVTPVTDHAALYRKALKSFNYSELFPLKRLHLVMTANINLLTFSCLITQHLHIHPVYMIQCTKPKLNHITNAYTISIIWGQSYTLLAFLKSSRVTPDVICLKSWNGHTFPCFNPSLRRTMCFTSSRFPEPHRP